MKLSIPKTNQVFFIILLSFSLLFLASCNSDCPGQKSDLTIENQWNRSIHVEVYTGGYVTHNTSLSSGERITFRVENREIEVRTREKGFLLFPDRTTTSFDARGCWNYEVIAYTDPNNGEKHFLETNQIAQ